MKNDLWLRRRRSDIRPMRFTEDTTGGVVVLIALLMVLACVL